jgi:hypothetical protein
MLCFPTGTFELLLLAALLSANLLADPVPVRHLQGSAHGFVALKTLEGTRIAVGDMTQVVDGDRVTSRVVFHFRDGSVDDDTTVFTQRGVFRLITDHHIQRGPAFPRSSDVFINASTGRITSHTKDGKIRHDYLDLPRDVSNGLPPNLLMNVLPSTPETKLRLSRQQRSRGSYMSRSNRLERSLSQSAGSSGRLSILFSTLNWAVSPGSLLRCLVCSHPITT